MTAVNQSESTPTGTEGQYQSNNSLSNGKNSSFEFSSDISRTNSQTFPKHAFAPVDLESPDYADEIYLKGKNLNWVARYGILKNNKLFITKSRAVSQI